MGRRRVFAVQKDFGVLLTGWCVVGRYRLDAVWRRS
jgi:hypothetical protein